MQLESIEISGFKSFAKKSGLEFKSPITAVVGPNGSGKSNIAEAFRFVLGEQSMKSMRGKKGEDMIWNGSNSAPRAGRAGVKVSLDNTDINGKRMFDLDFDTVLIERVVNRDGTNEYKLNGSAVRLKDVIELLAGAHIGSSGHHIISQGEADKVLNASPKERKSIIEDALGLKIYQYKREESERKLAKTFENITQVEALRKEIAPHLRFLKSRADKMAKAEAEREELILLGRTYFYQEENYINTTRASLNGEKEPVEERLVTLAQELGEAKRVLEETEGKDKREYAVLGLETEINELRRERSSFERELGKVEGKLQAEERLLAREREKTASEEHRTVKLKEVESLYSEISQMATVMQIIGKVKAFIEERRHAVYRHIEADAERRVSEYREERAQLAKTLENLENKEQELVTKYNELKLEIDKDKDSNRDAEKAVFRIMSEQNELESKRKELSARLETVRVEEEEFKRELEEVAHLVGTEVLKYREPEHFQSPAHGQASGNSRPTENVPAPRHEQDEMKRKIQRLKIRLEDAGLAGSEEVLKEYRDTSERDSFLESELLDLRQSADALEGLIKDLEERLSKEFSSGVGLINKEFKELFSILFDGGEAKLVVTKEAKPSLDEDGCPALWDTELREEVVVEEGLEIAVSLPRKKIRGLTMLSGGERALTSIALIFAVSQVNPPPFIILDETDAALDEANSRKYGDMIVRLAKHSQLILITHNRETMSRAGTIYGVTMGSDGVSKLLSIEFEEAVQVAK